MASQWNHPQSPRQPIQIFKPPQLQPHLIKPHQQLARLLFQRLLFARRLLILLPHPHPLVMPLRPPAPLLQPHQHLASPVRKTKLAKPIWLLTPAGQWMACDGRKSTSWC